MAPWGRGSLNYVLKDDLEGCGWLRAGEETATCGKFWRHLEHGFPRSCTHIRYGGRGRLGKNEARKAGRDQKVKSVDAELGNLGHPKSNVEPQ